MPLCKAGNNNIKVRTSLLDLVAHYQYISAKSVLDSIILNKIIFGCYCLLSRVDKIEIHRKNL